MKILTPGLFCLVTFFLLFFTNETLSIWKGWLQWSSSKARIIGRCFLHWLSECKLSLTGKQRDLEMADDVMPAGVTRPHDLSCNETRATTLDEDPHAWDNDAFTTHL
jgi:hypothetical protein